MEQQCSSRVSSTNWQTKSLSCQSLVLLQADSPGVKVRVNFPKPALWPHPMPPTGKWSKKRFPEKMDESRLDAVIALYMRCAGYTPQEVANDLYRHAPAAPTDRAKMKDRIRAQSGRVCIRNSGKYWYYQCADYAGADRMFIQEAEQNERGKKLRRSAGAGQREK